MKTYQKGMNKGIAKAIASIHQKGLPVFQIRDGYIVAVHPGGRIVKLEKANIGLNNA